MKLFSQLILKHSIGINASPDRVWNFFVHLDRNYKLWHPKDHILFRWTRGKPLKVGSKFYAEQYALGKQTIYKGKISEIIPERKIVIKFSFPISIATTKIEWLIEPVDTGSVFTAITYMRFGGIYERFFKKDLEILIKSHDKHVGIEGENLKKVVENDL